MIRAKLGEGSPVEMLDDARPESAVPFQIDLKNAGKTPALGLTIQLEWENSVWVVERDDGTIMPKEMPNEPRYNQDLVFTIGAIGPGITHEHRGAFICKREVREAIKLNSRFTICGLVQYHGHDRPDLIYTTKFCLLWQGPKGPFCISGPYA